MVANLLPSPTPAAAVVPTSAPPVTASTPDATAVPPTPTPFYTGPLSPACGLQLPLAVSGGPAPTTALEPDEQTVEALREIIPDAALPALSRLLAAPETVGLAAFRVGAADAGAYLNADVAMPLASVVKVLHLVAYAEAVAAGELDPLSTVTAAVLDAYYLPSTDLGTHRRAITELEENGRIFGDEPTLLLDEVPWMMIRHSSNAATDYLHLLLGQDRLEATAVSLGLTTQTAPCTFLGQFLVMGNHTRSATPDGAAVRAYAEDLEAYGRDVALLADAYRSNPTFRRDELNWRSDTRRPTFDTQALFSDTLNAQGSARDYANLMARLALNGLSSGESSFIARRYLEWPMQFETNQDLFSNLGYKNGSLPGILTTVYYAYPSGEQTPIVVALFYRDLPRRTYQQWRRQLPHDELARWIISDPQAIPALRAVLEPAGS